MAAVAVLPAKQPDSVMEVDAPSATTAAAAEEDLYTRLKTLQRQLEFLEIQVGRIAPGTASCCSKLTPLISESMPLAAHHCSALLETRCPAVLRTQEEYIKEEQKNLKRELLRAQEEVRPLYSATCLIVHAHHPRHALRSSTQSQGATHLQPPHSTP